MRKLYSVERRLTVHLTNMGKINDIFANFFDDNFICLDHRYSILFFFMTLVEQQRRIRHHESLCIMSY